MPAILPSGKRLFRTTIVNSRTEAMVLFARKRMSYWATPAYGYAGPGQRVEYHNTDKANSLYKVNVRLKEA